MAEDGERSNPSEQDLSDEGATSEDRDAEAASASEDESATTADSPAQDTTPSDTKSEGGRRWTSKLWWALPILMVVEFYAYGHNGRLEICVGKEGDTDFSLVGQERTDENRWKFPRCETRLNLGLRSEAEARTTEGLKVACRGATIFRHQGQAKACFEGADGWVHQVEGHFVPPWEPAYYQHLFWFLQ